MYGRCGSAKWRDRTMTGENADTVSPGSHEEPAAAQGDLPPALRLPLLLLGFVSLVFGVGAGLARLGWHLPLPAHETMLQHGPLMVSGFLGTVIGLERAVALGRRWAYCGPLLTGLGGVALLLGAPLTFAATAMVLGSAVLLTGLIEIVHRQSALFTVTMALGAASWLCGNLLWLFGAPVPEVVTLWANFLVLTIAGERLELSRFLPPSPNAKRIFAVILVLLITGSIIATRSTGAPVYGIGLLALASWLARQDIARRTVRETGLTRFIAVCLLSGYAWLAVGGLILLGGGSLDGMAYDAVLHALLLGFVFSMIFGHAPLIVPSVMRIKLPYHWSLYLPLLVLHFSLVLRLGGDALAVPQLRSSGGLLNALALALFILLTISSVLRGRRAPG